MVHINRRHRWLICTRGIVSKGYHSLKLLFQKPFKVEEK